MIRVSPGKYRVHYSWGEGRSELDTGVPGGIVRVSELTVLSHKNRISLQISGVRQHNVRVEIS